MTSSNSSVWAWVRKVINYIVPLEGHELPKFIPMSLMFCCILFTFNLLRSVKDALLVTNVGAEAISFVKVYCVVPAAILFTILYAKMTHVMTQRNIFLAICAFFLLFFLTFTFIIYPNQALFHPSYERMNDLAKGSVSLLGFYDFHLSHFQWFFRLYAKWSYVLFYVLAELWGSIMLSLLFWQFANSITKTHEAKRFYPMFGFFGNIGLIVGGYLLMTFGSQNLLDDDTKVKAADNTEAMLSFVTMLVGVAIVTLMGLYWYMNKLIVNDPSYVAPAAAKKKEKHAMSITEGFKVIFSSKYLGFIFILVLCYGVSINLIEGPLKDAARKLYPTPVEYATAFMGKLTFYMGISTMAAYLISAQVLKRVSWLVGAALTPLMLCISGMGFFLFLIFDKSIENITGALFVAMNPLQIAVMCGMIQNICTKATKYSFFDPTKEMSYIPVGIELQTKGKAAVDVVGARLAKSFGGLIQSTLFMIFPMLGFIELAPYFMVIFGVLSIVWLVDIKLLYNEYKKFVDHK